MIATFSVEPGDVEVLPISVSQAIVVSGSSVSAPLSAGKNASAPRDFLRRKKKGKNGKKDGLLPFLPFLLPRCNPLQ
jgi:hypothetical protein